MILEKEFYFIRHGQTDHNILPAKIKRDYSENISLNATGIKQAKSIEPTILSLPIRTVCSSPLKRAQETKEIITSRLQADHYAIGDLGECTVEIWNEITRFGMDSPLPKQGALTQFIDRVRSGVNQALSLPGPCLIVAHGGVHWAICYLMSIDEHEWTINNCVPVHFSLGKNQKWIAKKLT